MIMYALTRTTNLVAAANKTARTAVIARNATSGIMLTSPQTTTLPSWTANS